MSVVEVLGKITEPTIRCFVNKARATVSSASFSYAGLFWTTPSPPPQKKNKKKNKTNQNKNKQKQYDSTLFQPVHFLFSIQTVNTIMAWN